MRSLVRLLVQLSAPRQLLQRPVPPARVASVVSAATGDGSNAPSDARPERRTGRTAKEQMTAAFVAALTDPRVLASLRPNPAGEVALLRAEVAALQAREVAALQARVRELEGRVREAVEAAAAAARMQAAGPREELAAVRAQLAVLTARVEEVAMRESAAGNARKQVSPMPGADLARLTTTLPAAAERVDLRVRDAGTRQEKLLLAAAKKGRLPEVERLLSDPAINPNVRDKFSWTALHRASFKGHTEVVEALLRTGADKEARTNVGLTALLFASMNGHMEVVAALLRAGADKEAVGNELSNGSTPLNIASWNGHTEVVEALLRAGADKEAKNIYGRTPLHAASQNGPAEVVEALLRAGADMEAKEEYGRTPLDLAKLLDRAEVVALLEGWRSK